MSFIADWGSFLAALLAFFLSHQIPVRPAIKTRLVAKLGLKGFVLAYSALSIILLTWVIVAAGRAPYIELWGWEPWMNYVPLLGMFVSIQILALSIGTPNRLSFGGWQNERYDPQHPGIIGWVRHPLLVALFLWAAAHMVPNGNLAHLIVFGLFAGFTLMGQKIIDRRSKRILGLQHWQALADTKREIRLTRAGMIRVGIGVLVYLAILHSHEFFIGVPPLIWD